MYVGGMWIKRVWRGVVVTLSHLMQVVAFFFASMVSLDTALLVFFLAMRGLGLGPCAVFFGRHCRLLFACSPIFCPDIMWIRG